MKVFVTGGTGHVGLNLVRTLLAEDHDPLVLVRGSSPVDRLPEEVETVRGDITEPSSLEQPVSECDGIAHLAGVINASTPAVAQYDGTPLDFYREVNVDATRTLIQLAADHGLESLVHTSTLSAHPDLPDDDSEYAVTKREADSILLSESWPVRTCSLHPSWVVGPRDYRLKRYPRYRDVASNLVVLPPLYSIGRINVVDVRDVARNIVAALETAASGHQLVTGSNVRKRTYVSEIANAYEGKCYVPSIPMAKYTIPTGINLLYRLGLVPYEADHSRVGLTGDKAVVPDACEDRSLVDQTPWRRTVADTVEWYEQLGLM